MPDIDILRTNCDSSKQDKNGGRLLDLCKQTGIRIVNGRCLGDSIGYFTCFSHNGAHSVIDYMLVTTSIFEMIEFFNISDPHHLSIHFCMSLSLKTFPYSLNQPESNTILQPLKQYKWQEGDSGKYACAMQNYTIKNKLEVLSSETPDAGYVICVNNVINHFVYILSEAAGIAGIRKKSKAKKNHAKKKRFKWYSSDCASLKYNPGMGLVNSEKSNKLAVVESGIFEECA